MLDFWFTLGSAVMDPKLLTHLNNSRPLFRKVRRTIIENDEPVVVDNPASGLLEEEATMKLRQEIRNQLKQIAPHLPISVHAAGKMAQLLVVPEIKFTENVAQAHGAYVSACGKAGVADRARSFSPLFPGFLGLCLVDAHLTTFLSNGPGTDADQAIEEFGIDPDPNKADLKVVNHLVDGGASDFLKAQTALLLGAGWQGGCGHQFFFWAAENNANERAILP